MPGLSTFEVTQADRGTRLDVFIAAQVPAMTRSRAHSLIEEGQVAIDGTVVIRAGQRLQTAQKVAITEPELRDAEPQAENLPLTVLHEDRDVVVINKAVGMVVHPGAGHHSGTVVNALLHHVDDLQGVGGTARPGLVHRLDKDTSGVMVVAKNDKALRLLQEAFKAREVEKTYLALVLGAPPESGTFETLYGRHPKHRVRFSGKVRNGKPAVTHFLVREQYAEAALVEVTLETGRTHQIRVHFAEAGWPLIGDDLYGPKKAQRPDLIDRQALHAWKLAFPHPRSGLVKTYTAQPPKDFARAMKKLKAVKPSQS